MEAGWKICPACETALLPPACPRCGKAVLSHWKRCPACEARLLCASCGRRLPAGDGRCPDCGGEAPAGIEDTPAAVRVEAVTGMEFVLVPGGEFDMGDTFGEGIENELPVHRVGLDGFHLGRFPVTQAQWGRLMPQDPSRFRGGRLPVHNVTLEDVRAFIGKLGAAGGARFDLPTEAQWEYAARSGGRQERYAGGDVVDALAWYAENSAGRPHEVGGRRPNGLGLFDMSGNVWEWCRDVYARDAYLLHAAHNPLAAGPGGEHVIRGGSWSLDAWSARCARRFSLRAEDCGPGLGFRLAIV